MVKRGGMVLSFPSPKTGINSNGNPQTTQSNEWIPDQVGDDRMLISELPLSGALDCASQKTLNVRTV